MEKTRNQIDILWKSTNSFLTSFALILICNKEWKLKIHWSIILLCICVYLFLFLLIDFTKNKITIFIAISGFSAITIFGLYLKKENLIDFVKKIGNWFYNYQLKQENYQMAYAFILININILIITVLIYQIMKNKICYVILTIGMIALLICFAIAGAEVNKVSIAILLTVILESILEIFTYIGAKSQKDQNQFNQFNIKNYYLLPLCLIIATISVCLPAKTHPIKWKLVKEFISTVSDGWSDFSYYFGNFSGKYADEFSVNFSGYTDKNGEVFGNGRDGKGQVILKLNPSSKPYGSTYLIGSIRDEYTSTGWKRNKIDYHTDQEPIIDFYQILYDMYLHNIVPKDNENLFHVMDLTLKYNKIKTKTLFYPLKTYNITFLKDDIDYNSNTPTLLTKKILKEDFSYKLNYIEVNYASNTIKNYLRLISKTENENNTVLFNRDNCVYYLKHLAGIRYFDEGILNEKFINRIELREKSILKHYTKISKEVPKRVYDLAKQITNNYDNNYDKLKAIETYLSTFKYTLSPTKTKKGEDFVDYFLFEQKEGYCTYFATSMAILARCIGIPTRYVEGVIVDYNKRIGEDYLVSSNSCHAWVEAYIDGAGWIPFEPTPSRYGTRYHTWKEKVINKVVQPPIPEYSKGVPQDNAKQSLSQTKVESSHDNYIGKICIVIVIILCFLFVGVIFGLNYSKRRKFQYASSEEKIKILIRDILNYLESDGFVLEIGETFSDFVRRIGNKFQFKDITLEEICDIYTELRYANKGIEEIDLMKISVFHDALNEYIKKDMGWLRRLSYQLSLLVK